MACQYFSFKTPNTSESIPEEEVPGPNQRAAKAQDAHEFEVSLRKPSESHTTGYRTNKQDVREAPALCPYLACPAGRPLCHRTLTRHGTPSLHGRCHSCCSCHCH